MRFMGKPFQRMPRSSQFYPGADGFLDLRSFCLYCKDIGHVKANFIQFKCRLSTEMQKTKTCLCTMCCKSIKPKLHPPLSSEQSKVKFSSGPLFNKDIDDLLWLIMCYSNLAQTEVDLMCHAGVKCPLLVQAARAFR